MYKNVRHLLKQSWPIIRQKYWLADIQRLLQGIYRLQLVDKLFSKIVPFYNIILFDIIIELLSLLQKEASEMENGIKSEDLKNSEKADDQEKSWNTYVKDPTTGIKVSTK